MHIGTRDGGAGTPGRAGRVRLYTRPCVVLALHAIRDRIAGVIPHGKKHYKLRTDTMTSLVEYVQHGHTLETHNDIPKDICEQLYAEERQAVQRHQKASRTSAANLPPIAITITVLPAPSHLVSSIGTPAPDMTSFHKPIPHLNMPGFLYEQVEEYCTWQQSRFKKPNLKVEYQKACDVIIADGMALELIRQDPNPKYLTDKGVKRGPAFHVVSDIDYWLMHHSKNGIKALLWISS
jgi:hypothetical protein